MPTYEYLCKTCGHRFETWQKMSDEPLTVCPTCGAEIHRVLFANGVVFKGSGFYSTETRAQPSETSSAETPAASANGSNGDSGAKDSPAKDSAATPDAPAATAAASSSAASSDTGSKTSASKDSGKDS
jgi:putative FmdB family regulatory protein